MYVKTKDIMGSLGMESTEPLSEDVLHDLKKQVLQEHRQKLCETLYPRDHYPCLRGSYILTRDDEERVQAYPTTKAQASALLDIIITKGPGAFDALCKSLQQNRTQIFLLKLLNLSLEEKINKIKGLYLEKPELTTRSIHPKATGNNITVIEKTHHLELCSLPVPGEDGGPDIPD